MSIIHLPGMRYIRDGQIEELEEQDNTKLIPQHWKHPVEQDKLAAGFFQTADYSQSAQAYESLLRNRSYLENAALSSAQSTQQSQVNHYSFSPQQVYATPTYYTTQQQQSIQQQQEQLQQLDLQKRPIRKRRRPPHSYASLIAQAILTSKDQRLTLREIYEWVQTRYPHLYEANETGWQVGIPILGKSRANGRESYTNGSIIWFNISFVTIEHDTP
jgi:hypothetical protein